MATLTSSTPTVDLARHEGWALLTASQAIVKGLFEAEGEVSLLAGSWRDPFGGLGRAALSPEVAEQMRRHGMSVRRTPDASRALHLAMATVRAGGGAVVCIANDELDGAISHLSELPGGMGPLVVVLEDRPHETRTSPRRVLLELGMTAIEPADVSQLRDAMEHATTLSRAASAPVAVVSHVSLLRTADTIRLGPNRVPDSVDGQMARRRRQRRPRGSEVGGVLRMARRLELNRGRSMPSPGEREPWGFVTVGPADAALRHLLFAVRLVGSIPHLQLRLLHPIDDAAVGRIVTRCDRVVVLEPRPGEMEAEILHVAERIRRRGETPALIWGSAMPPDADGVETRAGPDDHLFPSVLARSIERPLHSIRPALGVASLFAAEPPPLPVDPPPRGGRIGPRAAVAALREVVRDAQQQLAELAADDDDEDATTLALDGVVTPPVTGRIVTVEVLDRACFERDGRGVVVLAARDERPCVVLVYAGDPDGARDLERLAQGMVPGDRAERVRIATANLAERAELLQRLREAALADDVTVIVVQDGPPARFHPAAADRAVAEIDRLGFQPAQRMVGPADHACEFATTRAARRPTRVAAGASLQTRIAWSESSARLGQQLRVRPLLERVEVIRTRAPARQWQRLSTVRLPIPVPVHGRNPVWRVHLAGVRGPAPGVVTRVLCDAGRLMGFAVRSVHDPTPTGPGRRAWAQVMMTHPRADEDPPPLTPWIPYAEADLLLVIDGDEALRAIGPEGMRIAVAERTGAVANTGPFEEQGGDDAQPIHGEALVNALRPVSRPESRLFEDFAGASRAWFHTDRHTDLAVLGAAFQMGLVPLSVEALETAVRNIEHEGFGRAIDALQFGRRLAADAALFSRPKIDEDEDVSRTVRRMALFIRQRSRRRSDAAQQFEWLATRCLAEMPGLSETDPGRAARRVFLEALYRCVKWGGMDFASRYARLVTELYHVDRGDKGRSVTRNMILPLAEAELIRDAVYVATMVTCGEHRRRIRAMLNVKPAREDRLESRYLTRIEVAALRRRLRIDLRTTDWLARLAARAAPLIPARWRGSRRERDLRTHLEEFVRNATESRLADYERWAEIARRLNAYAVEGRLRGMSAADLRIGVAPERTATDRAGE